MSINTNDAAGWKAINQALLSFYGEKETKYFCADDGFSRGNAEPLEGISVYKSSSEKPHWHYVTFGFSDLEEKESESTELSGYGFELTFRLLAQSKEKSPPSWPCELLNDIARNVFESSSALHAGAFVEFHHPINIGSGTKLEASVVAHDSELGTIQTPNGSIDFLQVFGLTADEVHLLKRWSGDQFLATIKQRLGKLLITDLDRESMSDDPCVALKIEESIRNDSRTGSTIKCPIAEWIFMNRISVSLSKGIVADLRKFLPERLKADSDLTIRGPECKIVFRKARKANFNIEDTDLIIELPLTEAQKFCDQLAPDSTTCELAGLPVTFEFTS